MPPSGARRRRGEPRARRGGTVSFDPERERALGDVGVDREHAPLDLVRSRRERRDGRPEEPGVRALETAAAAGHPDAARAHDTAGTVRPPEARGGRKTSPPPPPPPPPP